MKTEMNCEPGQFQGRIIFMSMYIVWGQEGKEELRIANAKIVADCAKRVARGHWREHIRANRVENGIESLRT